MNIEQLREIFIIQQKSIQTLTKGMNERIERYGSRERPVDRNEERESDWAFRHRKTSGVGKDVVERQIYEGVTTHPHRKGDSVYVHSGPHAGKSGVVEDYNRDHVFIIPHGSTYTASAESYPSTSPVRVIGQDAVNLEHGGEIGGHMEEGKRVGGTKVRTTTEHQENRAPRRKNGWQLYCDRKGLCSGCGLYQCKCTKGIPSRQISTKSNRLHKEVKSSRDVPEGVKPDTAEGWWHQATPEQRRDALLESRRRYREMSPQQQARYSEYYGEIGKHEWDNLPDTYQQLTDIDHDPKSGTIAGVTPRLEGTKSHEPHHGLAEGQFVRHPDFPGDHVVTGIDPQDRNLVTIRRLNSNDEVSVHRGRLTRLVRGTNRFEGMKSLPFQKDKEVGQGKKKEIARMRNAIKDIEAKDEKDAPEVLGEAKEDLGEGFGDEKGSEKQWTSFGESKIVLRTRRCTYVIYFLGKPTRQKAKLKEEAEGEKAVKERQGEEGKKSLPHGDYGHRRMDNPYIEEIVSDNPHAEKSHEMTGNALMATEDIGHEGSLRSARRANELSEFALYGHMDPEQRTLHHERAGGHHGDALSILAREMNNHPTGSEERRMIGRAAALHQDAMRAHMNASNYRGGQKSMEESRTRAQKVKHDMDKLGDESDKARDRLLPLPPFNDSIDLNNRRIANNEMLRIFESIDSAENQKCLLYIVPSSDLIGNFKSYFDGSGSLRACMKYAESHRKGMVDKTNFEERHSQGINHLFEVGDHVTDHGGNSRGVVTSVGVLPNGSFSRGTVRVNWHVPNVGEYYHSYEDLRPIHQQGVRGSQTEIHPNRSDMKALTPEEIEQIENNTRGRLDKNEYLYDTEQINNPQHRRNAYRMVIENNRDRHRINDSANEKALTPEEQEELDMRRNNARGRIDKQRHIIDNSYEEPQHRRNLNRMHDRTDVDQDRIEELYRKEQED